MQLLLKKALRLPPLVNEARIIDLLWHTPAGVIDRRATPTIAAAVPGTIATLRVRVLKHRPSPPGNSRAPYKVACEDETGRIDLVFFHADPRFVARQLPEGSLRYVSGRIESYNDRKQMAHPDYIVPPEARAELPMLEPVYPLTAGLSGKVLLKATRGALERVPELPEWQDAAWLRERAWPDFKTALTRLHAPETPEDVSAGSGSWQRLAYDELLAGQLALGLVRQSFKQQPGRSVVGDGHIRARIADALPFALTNSQRQALKEIAQDISAPFRMLRLLQGDVGSGKTVVALMAMAIAWRRAPGALMAPPVLARQRGDHRPLADRRASSGC
jgi:ATP-dependent DNA helicase RecG